MVSDVFTNMFAALYTLYIHILNFVYLGQTSCRNHFILEFVKFPTRIILKNLKSVDGGKAFSD